MIYYNGFTIWYNSLQGWMVQYGVEIATVKKSLGAAKAWTTTSGDKWAEQG